jgi:hypothetical protein
VIPSFEILLPVGAIAFYLCDSALLLHSNEMLFRWHSGGWSFAEGSSIVLFGRQLTLPNPLLPQQPAFRIHWTPGDSRDGHEDQAGLQQFLAALRPLGVLVRILLLLLLTLPLELWWFGAEGPLLLLFGIFYLVSLASLGYIYRRRVALGVTRRAFLWLTLDVLACAPFAVNLVRKLSLRRALNGNPVQFAHEAFSADQFGRLIDVLCAHLEREQHLEEDGTSRWRALETFRDELRSMRPCHPAS